MEAKRKGGPPATGGGGSSSAAATSRTPSPKKFASQSNNNILPPPPPKPVSSPSTPLLHVPNSSGKDPKKRKRSPYKCHKCGKPKKGHICTAMPNAALFKEASTSLSSPPPPSSPPLLIDRDSITQSSDSGTLFPSSPYNPNDQQDWSHYQNGDKEREEDEEQRHEGGWEETLQPKPFPPFLGDLGDMYSTSSDNLFPTDPLSRYEFQTESPSWPSWGLGSGSQDFIAPTTLDEFDISAFGYIDERPPENVAGIGFTLDSKKAPFFVSWFEMAISGMQMLETFLKTQKPVWSALDEVLAHLEEEKKRITEWKESFGNEVINKGLDPSKVIKTDASVSAGPPIEVMVEEEEEVQLADDKETGAATKRRRLSSADHST